MRSSFRTSSTSSSVVSSLTRPPPPSRYSLEKYDLSLVLMVSTPLSSRSSPAHELSPPVRLLLVVAPDVLLWSPTPSAYGMPKNRLPMSRPISSRFSSYSISYLDVASRHNVFFCVGRFREREREGN